MAKICKGSGQPLSETRSSLGGATCPACGQGFYILQPGETTLSHSPKR